MASTKADRGLRKALSEYEQTFAYITQPLSQEILELLRDGMPLSPTVKKVLEQKLKFRYPVHEAMERLMLDAMELGSGNAVIGRNRSTAVSEIFSSNWVGDGITPDMRLARAIEGAPAQLADHIQSVYIGMRKADKAIREINNMVSSPHVTVYRKAADRLREARIAVNLASGNTASRRQFTSAANVLSRALTQESPVNVHRATQKLIQAFWQVQEEALAQAVDTGLNSKVAYRLERIARTEASRVWFEQYTARYKGNSNVFGYRWRLSPLHNVFDQCDVLAYSDIGYGVGIYPKDHLPTIPRHPHCRCTLTVVRPWEVNAGAQINERGVDTYLRTLPLGKLQELFGIDGAREYRNGGYWQNLLRGWDYMNFK